jgi:heme-degrading monooxygenase HmoA
MLIQIVRFESELPEDGVVAVANERIEGFRALPGLIQKYYVKMAEPNWYGGIYIWDSMESLSAYRHSDLASTIPAAYRVKGTPKVEILNCLMPLREPR